MKHNRKIKTAVVLTFIIAAVLSLIMAAVLLFIMAVTAYEPEEKEISHREEILNSLW